MTRHTNLCHKIAILFLLGATGASVRAWDWPRLFGPTGDSVAAAEDLDWRWGVDAPPVLWKLEVGESYTSPSMAGGRLVVFHRLGDEEVVDCLDVSTATRQWRYTYPTRYVDQYGYNNGPRATPIIHEGRVYTLGAEGKLHCLSLESGEKIWDRWLNREYQVDQEFFGVGASPILDDDRLIINVGGIETGAGIVAIGLANGKTVWIATSDGPSYATPIAATMHGRPLAFVFTKNGLVCLESADGVVHWKIPFRSRLYESVNATSPIVVGDIVLVSASYGTGSLCVRVKDDTTHKILWRGISAMDSHFSNMMHRDGFVYGFAGRHEGDAELRCFELATGRVRWSVSSVLGRGSMIRVGDKSILWGERGHLFVRKLQPDAPPELPSDPEMSEPLLSYPCWTPPAISDGRLFLRNEKLLICYDLSTEGKSERPEKSP